ncbi:MAG: RluA family pseudouridine synthase [Angustibacter sp.]
MHSPDGAFDLRALPVPDGLGGDRLDVGLARLLGLSRTRVGELVAAGRVEVDGRRPVKSERLIPGSWLEVQLPRAAAALPDEPVVRLSVVHEDDDIVVVDKPVGVAAHPAPGWTGPTVVGGLAGAGVIVASSGAAERQGIVHRLDVGTSGLMVVAKSERAYASLKAAFRDRTVDKTYHALVQGHPDPSRGTIDAPIGRHPSRDGLWAVTSTGKDSVTHYQTVEAFRSASLLEVHLETGRTHQIRVHVSAVRHPCVGDLAYGADPVLADRLGLQRQWLHAVQLGFEHPGTGRPVRFDTAYPGDLTHALELVAAG